MWPEFGLSFIDCIVVAVELVGVMVFEEAGEFVEELEHLRGGFVGEVERKVDAPTAITVTAAAAIAVAPPWASERKWRSRRSVLGMFLYRRSEYAVAVRARHHRSVPP